jgi:hypothetical protein
MVPFPGTIRITFAESVRNLLILSALALWLCSVAAAQPHWSWRNPLPQGDNLNGVAWTGQRLIAVGVGGSILTAEQDPVGSAPWRIRLPETRPGLSRDLLGRGRSGSAIIGSFQPKSDPKGIR